MRKITLIILLLVSITACTQRYVSYTDVAQVNGFGLFYAAEGHGKPAVFGFSDGAIATGGANIFVEDALIPSFAESFLAEPAMTPQDMLTIQATTLIMAGEHDLILEDYPCLLLDFFERTDY